MNVIMNTFAPVLIPTLNRYEHFKRCVESLSACTHAEKTDFFIFLDYPLKDAHWEGYELIKAYLPNIKGFKTVNVIEREKNYGAVENIFKSMEYVFDKYDRLIFSEDDNEFSPNFLDYINKGLEKFENDPNIVAICGYNYPIVMPKNYIHNYYYYEAFSAWGFGAWKNKPIKEFYNPDEIIGLLTNKKFIKKSIQYYGLAQLFSLLIAVNRKVVKYGDGAITINLLKENRFCVFPTVTKLRNHGHDGSGVNCGIVKDNTFIKQRIDIYFEFSYSKSVPIFDRKIQYRLRKYFGLTLKGNLTFIIKYLIFRMKYSCRVALIRFYG